MTRFAIATMAFLVAFGCSPENAESDGDEAATQPIVTEEVAIQPLTTEETELPERFIYDSLLSVNRSDSP